MKRKNIDKKLMKALCGSPSFRDVADVAFGLYMDRRAKGKGGVEFTFNGAKVTIEPEEAKP